jgi:hypothetical protein
MSDKPVSDNTPGDSVIDKGAGVALESVYYRQAIDIKQKLATISPSMCLAKWAQVSIHLTNGQTHSCYHPPAHKIPLHELQESPSALHNTKHKIAERELMKKG